MNTIETEGRVARRQRRNRDALLKAGHEVISEKGIDAATMMEIAERADVASGTIYNYFKSKDELAIAVLELVMEQLARRIENVTNTFADPAQVYAFGIRTVLETATGDIRWRQLLHRSEVIANATFQRMGPFAIRDLKNATIAGRLSTPDPELTWRMSCFAIVGISLAMTKDEISVSLIEETVARLLCMAGMSETDAHELAARPRPPLPPEAKPDWSKTGS
ncbi:TetR/AcrR family transcriptional regulator (plasmid) [Agrobacterium fabrum]|uniref:TetR/AcrR family transcriptional regulator n=1 Tax=Agrobacterium fabrum TaxID=1176649 RepID=UPI0021D0A15B|nr:TetR/AcrR family transcriptional regulator [Agrobacterium fabrum]UXT61258.1 TetR/AcrR family transcriptional regulator [Agrobacterium fabrum]